MKATTALPIWLVLFGSSACTTERAEKPPAEEASAPADAPAPEADPAPVEAAATGETRGRIQMRPTDETRGDARSIVARAVEAKGGLPRLKAIERVQTLADGTTGRMRITIAFPDRYLIEYLGPGGERTSAIALDGDGPALHQAGDGPPKALPDNARRRLRAAARASAVPVLIAASAPDADLKSIGAADVDGRMADGVRFTAADGFEVDLFVDRETGDLIGLRYGADSDPTTVLEGDFRPVDGVRVAHSSRITHGGVVSETTIESVRFDVTVTPATFRLPGAAKPATP